MDILNKNEKKEISDDVKAAFNKAKNRQSKKVDKKVYIISIIVIALIFLIGVYIFFNNNPKVLFTKGIDNVFSVLSLSNPDYDIVKGNVNYVYGNKNLKVNYDRDYSNNLIKGSVTNNSGKVDFYIDGHDLYVLIGDISPQYIKLDKGTFYSATDDEVNTLLKELKGEINKVISLQKFKGNKTDIRIDGKNVKAYCSSLMFTDDILIDIFNNLKDNNNFVDTYSKVMNVSHDEGKALLLNMMNDFKLKFSNSVVKVYTTGISHEVVMIDIVKGDNTYSILKKDRNKYSVSYGNDVINIDLDERKISGGNINISVDDKKSSNFKKISMKNSLHDDDSVSKAKSYLDDFFA